MALAQGVAPHRAWLSVNGFLIPVISGDATQNGTRRSSTFSATISIYYPGAEGALAGITDKMSGVIVQNAAGSGPLVMGEIDSVDFHYGQNGTIHVSGRDMSSKLHNKKINKKWTDQPTTQVVQDVCQMAGLGCQASGGGMTAGKELSQEHAKMADGAKPQPLLFRNAQSRIMLDGGAMSAASFITISIRPAADIRFITILGRRNTLTPSRSQSSGTSRLRSRSRSPSIAGIPKTRK